MMARNTPRLETDRLILRRFQERDIPAILDIFGDPEVNTFLPWFPLKSMEEAERFYQERFAAVDGREAGCACAICRKQDDLPVGYVHAELAGAHDFGYGLRRAFWHRGIVTEAAQAVIAFLAREGVPFLTATHDVKNPRSGAVMRRLGMKYCYSYREQWMPKDFPVVFRMYQLNLNGEYPVYRGYWEKYAEHFVEEGL